MGEMGGVATSPQTHRLNSPPQQTSFPPSYQHYIPLRRIKNVLHTFSDFQWDLDYGKIIGGGGGGISRCPCVVYRFEYVRYIQGGAVVSQESRY